MLSNLAWSLIQSFGLLTKIQCQQKGFAKRFLEFASLYGTKLVSYSSVLTIEFIFSDWSQFHYCYFNLYESNRWWWWWWSHSAPWQRHIHKIDIPLKSIVMRNNACTKMSPQVVCFGRKKEKQKMHTNNSSSLDQIIFRTENLIKIPSKDVKNLFLSAIHRNRCNHSHCPIVCMWIRQKCYDGLFSTPIEMQVFLWWLCHTYEWNPFSCDI